MEVVEDHLFNLLLNLLGLPENDVAFPLDCLLLELRVLEDVLKNVDTLRDVFVERFGEIDCVFSLFSRSVQR